VTTWGDFELIEEIGRGAFASVYRANHPTLQQQVALKLIPVPSGDPRDVDKALDEPRRLASIRHRHVVTVHDARYADGCVGICMELIRGESLAQIVERQGPFGSDETMVSGSNLCRALAAMHRAQIVHNDIKAQNVMREDGGRIVLMDFGAGRRLVDPTRTTGLHLVGTPAYMAPELFALREPTAASDLYSLGVLLFYLLSGRFPVEGTSLHDFVVAHASGRRNYLADFRDDVPARELGVIERALDPDPGSRYRTAGEMLSAIADRTDDDTERGRTKPRERVPPEPVRKVWVDSRTPADPSPTPLTQRQWLQVGAATLIGLLVMVWVIGFLSSKAYDVMFGLPSEFASQSSQQWLELGFQTLPLPIAYVLMAVTAFAVARFMWQTATRLSSGLRTWSAHTARAIEAATSRSGLTERRTITTTLLLVQLLLVAAFSYRFREIVAALTTPIADGAVAAHAQFAPGNENEWLFFRGVTTILALACGTAWWIVGVRRGAAEHGLAPIVAGIALTVVFALLSVVPWRIVHQSTFEMALLDSERCFVVAGTATHLLLHCPDVSGKRNLVVNQSDSNLKRLSKSENIFAAIGQPSDTRRR
jgi:serine/threonine protein kinase